MSLSDDTSLEDFFKPYEPTLSDKVNVIQTKLNQLRYLIDTKSELHDKKIYIQNINDSIEELDLKKFIDNLSKI
jgi:hypothetical protein